MASMNLISWLTSVSTVLIMLVAGFFKEFMAYNSFCSTLFNALCMPPS